MHHDRIKDLFKDSYLPALEASLPNPKGVPLEKARTYMEQADPRGIQVVKLDHLVDSQRKYMPFRYRVGCKYNYYAVRCQYDLRGNPI